MFSNPRVFTAPLAVVTALMLLGTDGRAQRRHYVHVQEQPTLIINDLKLGAQAKGAVALLAGVNSVSHFRNLTITPITPAPAGGAR